MKFFDQRTAWAGLQPSIRKNITCDGFYDYVAGLSSHRLTQTQVACEQWWYSLGSPYYLLYPSIVPMFTALRLDIETRHIRLPLQSLSIRFPDPSPLGFDAGGKHWGIRTILATDCDPSLNSKFKFQNGGRGICVWIDWGETNPDVPDGYAYRAVATGEIILLGDGATVEDRLNSSPEILGGGGYESFDCPREIIADCFRVVCTLCLLGNNPEIIEPDWLKSDETKVSTATEDDLKRFEKRAIARKGWGWRIGEGIEKLPHLRRPHPALIRVGHGRTERKLIFRSGSLVHRETVSKVPTGFLSSSCIKSENFCRASMNSNRDYSQISDGMTSLTE